jgi:small subunit ribosomal protein S1
VLSIDASKERISLGIKQLDEDPLTAWLSKHPKNSIVNGTVVEVEKNNVSVNLSSGVLGSIKTSELSVEKIDDARKAFKIDDEIEAKLISVDNKNRSILLSVKAKETHEEEEALSNYQSEASAVKGATTLGELLKEKMKDN